MHLLTGASPLVRQHQFNGEIYQDNDKLLPKLISGEVRVRAAEKMMGEAV